jgi:hypothetical protein
MAILGIGRTSALFALLALGCSDDGTTGSTDPASEGAKDPALDVEGTESGKGAFDTDGYKADCLDCDPEGPNALAQLGLRGDFWSPGERWQVAYVLKSDKRIQMQDLAFGEDRKAEAGLIVLDFRVKAKGRAVIAGKDRETITLEITQGEARGSVGRQLADADILQASEVTERIELVMDDLLRPVSVTEFSGTRGAFPNGRTRALDPREVVRSLDTSFPYIVPNAYLAAAKERLPGLPETLVPVADAAAPGWAERDYFHFDLRGRSLPGQNAAVVLDAQENVYWAAGDPWPFYVETPSAVGVLISKE